MTNSDSAYVFSRITGPPKLVGRYRYVRAGTTRALGEFGYAGSWLRDEMSFPLDPANLPLSKQLYRTTKRGCLFGPLADATPDRWGRELAALRSPGKLFAPVDWLYAPGRDRVGCLDFSPGPQITPATTLEHLGLGSIAAIAAEFEKIQAGLPASPEAERIYNAGVAMGGARPKAVVEDGGQLWIAKFERGTDTFDQCGAEHATMRLAAICGIETAETRLVGVGPRKAALVKRFDRSAGPDFSPVLHFITALSLLDGDETSAAGSYFAIAAELLRHGLRPDADRIELFRRMVFNVLCGNRDDHLKNHALVYGSGGWRLSPAYDVVPQPDLQPEHAIAIGRAGVYPSISNCLTRCGDFGLTLDAARAEVERVSRLTANWRSLFADEGIAGSTMDKIAPAFAIADAVQPEAGHRSP